LVGVFGVALALLLPAGHAQAADPRAESLFQEALELMKGGSFADACPKLRASQDIEPMSGTLIMLANCHEQVGKTATAWAQYKEAASLARTEGRQKNVHKASALAAAVEPRLSKLRIEAAAPTAELTVLLDGSALPPGTFDTAVAVDPGEHVVSASAPGHVDWSTSVTLGADGDTQTVTIPALEPSPQPSEPTPAAAPAPPPASDASAPEGGVPAWAWIVGGVGVALAVAAVVFRVDQSAAASELDDRCGSNRQACPPEYDFQSDRAREERDFGLFVGFGAAGVVCIGAAIIGMATAPSGTDSPSASVQATPWIGLEAAGGSIRLVF
jgi:hypothetical protein